MCRRESEASAEAGAPEPADDAGVDEVRLTLRVSPAAMLAPLLALAVYGVFLTAPWRTRGAPADVAPLATSQRAAADALDEVEPPDDALEEIEPASSATPEPEAALLAARARTEPAPMEEDTEPPALAEPRAAGAGAAAEPSTGRAARAAAELASARQLVTVDVYYTEWCSYCQAAREYLARQGIRSSEHDVEKDASARRQHRRLNPRGSVPTLDIDGEVLVGFDPARIERALERAARARRLRDQGS